MKIPMRWNVLVLVGAGYASLLLIYAGQLLVGVSAADALVAIKEPLMVLIGGAIAISKDLVPLGSETESGPQKDA